MPNGPIFGLHKFGLHRFYWYGIDKYELMIVNKVGICLSWPCSENTYYQCPFEFEWANLGNIVVPSGLSSNVTVRVRRYRQHPWQPGLSFVKLIIKFLNLSNLYKTCNIASICLVFCPEQGQALLLEFEIQEYWGNITGYIGNFQNLIWAQFLCPVSQFGQSECLWSEIHRTLNVFRSAWDMVKPSHLQCQAFNRSHDDALYHLGKTNNNSVAF